ncbi:MAG: Rpn family recombination-promoting nuclease/putative transposase [Myxococcaceae bacterium]|nr:Rpn family recombination-promoting nuclease/putative transposase [Myxococcaceae bacterium]MBH2005896.1 Rpn family recombination-promoting nuclease/putative transposase [Myxococcaceae bacterium]
MEKPLVSFDYAIKYLLKNQADYDIIESFLSALLATEGYPPVKIKALIDPESQKEAKNQKRSIADLVVEDANGVKYMVEIERSYTTHFAHKACFNTSRRIIDSLELGQDFTQIKKVFHISLLYFEVPQMNHALAFGQTIIHEIDTQNPVSLHLSTRASKNLDIYNVFPEYFFICIPKFNDEVQSEIDEWLYMAKNEQIRADFQSKGMDKVAERLQVLKMTDAERNEYWRYLKQSVSEQDYYLCAEAKGRAQGQAEGEAVGLERGKAIGLEKGKAEAKVETAVKLLKLGLDKSVIATATELPREQIEQLEAGLIDPAQLP